MTADGDTAEKYDQYDGARKTRAFSGQVESGFPSENATTRKNTGAVPVSSQFETGPSGQKVM
jgi:hypothetical protein